MVRKMPYYLCVDDESGDRLEPILEPLRRSGVDVRLFHPEPFDKEVARILSSDADGLLLDLRLDDVPDRTGARVRYHALSLAQELRTRMTEGDLRPLPIVLWSVERKFRRSYSNDSTAHDLFDLVVSKTRVAEQRRPIASKLMALAADYPKLHSPKPKAAAFWGRVLSLDTTARDLLDPRIGAELRPQAPAHEYARYVIRELLERPGPLIDEALLAARLGVSLESSDWDASKEKLDSARYAGVFSAGWLRWWWPAVERSLRRIAPEMPFRALPASDRVDILRRFWGLDSIEPIKALTRSTGTRYWHVCEVTGVPLDPQDAVAIEGGDRKPWQDALYVSIDAALSRRAAARGIRIHPLEAARLEAMNQE